MCPCLNSFSLAFNVVFTLPSPKICRTSQKEIAVIVTHINKQEQRSCLHKFHLDITDG